MNTIAGVALKDANEVRCKVHVDAKHLASNFAVSSHTGLDGSASVQAVEIDARPFSVRLPFCPANVLAAIIASVNAALASGQAFRVSLMSALLPVDHLCATALVDWFSYDPTSRGEIIRDVQLNFVALADA